MSQTQLTATIPTTRQDGSPLASTDIASITFQKVPAGAAPGTAPTVLTVNSASPAGSGLAPSQLGFNDTSAAVGDSYTAFVTDTAGTAGALSNAYVNAQVAPPPPPAAPAAPTLSGTFTP